jgi:hypothetical protein
MPIAAGSAKPSMPIALRKPSGSVAGMRACSSGRLDGVSYDDRRRGRAGEQVRERAHGVRAGRLGAQQRDGAEDLVRLGRGRAPVVHRHDHDRRAAPGGGLVMGAADRPRYVLRADGLIDPTRGSRRPGRAAARPGRGPAQGGGGPAGRPGPRAARGSGARWRARRPRCRAPASSAAAPATARRARSRGRPPSRPPTPRAARVRSAGPRAARPGTAPPSSPDLRRSWSVRGGAAHRRSRCARCARRPREGTLLQNVWPFGIP